MGILQMTWQPSLLKSEKRKHGGPPLGLRNLGNSCYLNSVLQCLTYTPPLANFCLRLLHSSNCDLGAAKEKKGDCPFCILEKRITRSLSSEAALDAPAKINSCLRIYAEHFRPGRQEDAHEFLRYVIDACHNTCLRLKKLQQQPRVRNSIINGLDINGGEETVVKEIFGGALQSQVKCLSCGAESNKVDEIMDLSLDILHSGSLKDALQKFFQPEILDGNNKYKCDNCKKLVAARKQMSILEAPNVFVIQLKRFEGIFGGKVDKLISFEDILILSNYMCKASQDQHPEYNLFGTIVHSGYSSDSGHYYAYIKDAIGRWYCCNDSYVSISTKQEVLSEKVYILFFSRTKQKSRARVGVTVNGSKSYDSNDSKTSSTQKLNGVQKSVFVKKLPNKNSETNNSTYFNETNGCESSSVRKLGCSGKPFSMNHNSSYLCDSNGNPLRSNGVKRASIQNSDRNEASVNGNPPNHTGMNVSINSVQKSGALIGQVDKKSSSNHNTQTSSSMTSEVDQENLNLQRKNGISVSTNRILATVNTNISVRKRESKEESDYAAASIISIQKEKMESPVKGKNGACEESVGLQISLNGRLSAEVCQVRNSFSVTNSIDGSFLENIGLATMPRSWENVGCQDQQNGSCMGSSNNFGMKRKMEGNKSCILLETDDQSRAEVKALKELLHREASLMLRSSGWYDELYCFMHASKKLCQGDGTSALNGNENKKSLISHAKRNFISKVPESLKGSLVEHLRLFSQGKQPS